MKLILTSLALIASLFAGPANAAFVNSYDVSNWTKTLNGGSINTINSPNSVSLTSSNVGTGNRNQDFTIKAANTGLVTFNWSFVSKDKDGPKYDPFGILLNGVFTQLTSNAANKKNQSGNYSLHVNMGDIFGFRANSTDSALGAATTTISNFDAPEAVPVPAAAWLFAVPMLAMLRKKKSA